MPGGENENEKEAVRKGKLVYVGETGELQGRMRDLLNSRHHNLRRKVGYEQFHGVPGFKKATSSIKFPDYIEGMVNDFFEKHIQVSFIIVKLGRKELEERIFKIYGPLKYNDKGRRGS